MNHDRNDEPTRDYAHDTELTAYALGELDSQAQAKWDELYRADPACRRAVDDLRALGTALASEFAAEALPAIMPISRDALGVNVEPPRRRNWWLTAGVVTGAASMLFIMLSSLAVWRALVVARQRSVSYEDRMLAETSKTLPSPYYVNDDIGYVPNSREVKLSTDAEVHESAPTKGQVVFGEVTVGRPQGMQPSMGLPEGQLGEAKAISNNLQELRMQREVVTTKPTGNPLANPATAPLLNRAAGGGGPKLPRLGTMAAQPTATTPTGNAPTVHNPVPAASLPGAPAPVASAASAPVPNADGDQIQNFSYFMGFTRGEGPQANAEAYSRIHDNKFMAATESPLSTFSIDVDTASYSNVRRFLTQNQLPPADAVRIEELINYFPYDYTPPTDDRPFASHIEVAGCPWNPEHRLVRFGLKGRIIQKEARPPVTLTFLIDVSGSMQPANKLPLLKSALRMLVQKLGENDRVAMVVYAGASGIVLPSTYGLDQDTILTALDKLEAGGSTNGASGIQLAYQVATENFTKGGVNRVVLCTDGDFNVGITNHSDLTKLIEDKAKTGVFLSVLGFGMGNLKDATLENLADRGNGNYAYIDTQREARKVLVEQLEGTLITIAKDVKIQVEFNPAEVAQYRLIGYENRMLKAEDFNDDKKDAGEIGAGHTVTALYEIVPAKGVRGDGPKLDPAVDPLKYQKPQATVKPTDAAANGEMLTLKLRYKEPDGDKSKLIEFPVRDAGKSFDQASRDFRFVASVASFGMQLRGSPYKGSITWKKLTEIAESTLGDDSHGYRGEFLDLIRKAEMMGAGAGNRGQGSEVRGQRSEVSKPILNQHGLQLASDFAAPLKTQQAPRQPIAAGLAYALLENLKSQIADFKSQIQSILYFFATPRAPSLVAMSLPWVSVFTPLSTSRILPSLPM